MIKIEDFLIEAKKQTYANETIEKNVEIKHKKT